MAFIDNPIISALGGELGLGGVFAAAGSPPATPESDSAGNPVKPPVSKPNVPPYRNRPYIPRMEGGPMSHVGAVGPGGLNPTTPGTMDPATLQDPNVQKMLGQYGVTPPTTPPDPNLFIHNQQAFQNHPVISGLLEHGLEGLAYAHPGANFLQSLIGGVQGMQEANAARGQQVNAQTMAPILQAQQIASLQKMGDEHDNSVSEQHYRNGMLDVANQNADTKEQQAARTAPRKNADGTSSTWNPSTNKWDVDPTLGRDEQTYQKNQYFSGAAHELAASKYGGDIGKLTAADYAAVNQNWEKGQSLAKGAAAMRDIDVRSGDSRYRTDHPAAGGMGRPGYVSPQSKLQYNELTNQENEVNGTIKAVTNAKGLVTDDTGKIVVAGSQAHKAYLGRLQSRQAQIRQQKSVIDGSATAPSTPSVPDGADGVYDPVQKKVIYRSK